MNFNNIKDLKYSKADNSTIDLLATCKEYGEIPMTLNIVDTEDNHHFSTGKFEIIMENKMVSEKQIILEDGIEKEIEVLVEKKVETQKEILIPLEKYCKTLKISPYVEPILIDLEPNKKYEADRYLRDTDWVKDYKLRHDLGLELIAEDSNKWEIIKQREIYLEFLKTL